MNPLQSIAGLYRFNGRFLDGITRDFSEAEWHYRPEKGGNPACGKYESKASISPSRSTSAVALPVPASICTGNLVSVTLESPPCLL